MGATRWIRRVLIGVLGIAGGAAFRCGGRMVNTTGGGVELGYAQGAHETERGAANGKRRAEAGGSAVAAGLSRRGPGQLSAWELCGNRFSPQ